MKIFMTCPALTPHGGIRVILEWANRLSVDNTVYLRTNDRQDCDWFPISKSVQIAYTDKHLQDCDCLIISSPHGIRYQYNQKAPKKKVIFMQMLEHYFRPLDKEWQKLCAEFYLSDNPVIAISQWNIDYLNSLGRRGKTFYVGNGVNLNHFPVSMKEKDGKTVLVEGWVPTNPSKDSARIAQKVAKRLADKGYTILAYSQRPYDHSEFEPHEYYCRPNNNTLNDLYERANILIKATKYDARSCAPMEAMTKGTVTARAIMQGDDDLVHGVNALRCGYDEDSLFDNALSLLSDNNRREVMAQRCREYVQLYTWDYWMNIIRGILSEDWNCCG